MTWLRALLLGAAVAALYFAMAYGVRYGGCSKEWSPLAPPASWC